MFNKYKYSRVFKKKRKPFKSKIKSLFVFIKNFFFGFQGEREEKGLILIWLDRIYFLGVLFLVLMFPIAFIISPILGLIWKFIKYLFNF